MAKLREVRIIIGKRSYRMQTALDDPTLNRVTAIVDEVGQAIGSGTDQDHLLMLTCLQLAYTLEKISTHLERLEIRLEDLPPWTPSSDTDEHLEDPEQN